MENLFKIGDIVQNLKTKESLNIVDVDLVDGKYFYYFSNFTCLPETEISSFIKNPITKQFVNIVNRKLILNKEDSENYKKYVNKLISELYNFED